MLGGIHGYKVSFEDKDDRDIYDSKPKLGYRLGAYIAFPLENNFSWSTELYYSKKGRKLETNSYINDADYNFIEASVLLRKSYPTKILDNLKGKWFFNIGPNINYWLGGSGLIDDNVDLEYEVVFDENKAGGDLENNYIVEGNRWLFGLDFGIGMEAPILKTQSVQVEMRFTLGQTFLGTKDGSIPVNEFQIDDNLRSNYRVISFTIRYGFDVDLMSSRKGKSTIKRSNRRR